MLRALVERLKGAGCIRSHASYGPTWPARASA